METKDGDGFSSASYRQKRSKRKQGLPVKPKTFITPITSQRYRKKRRINQKEAFEILKYAPNITLQNFSAIMKDIQQELEFSMFMFEFRENLRCFLTEWDLGHIITEPDSCDTNVSSDVSIDIVCYGLGQFSSSRNRMIGRYQLGFLLILKKILQSAHVYIYDPVFSEEEIQVLKELGLNVLNINEKGKRVMKRKTVCFMPGCDTALYNNVLWANWNDKSLAELAIIGNSFYDYKGYPYETNMEHWYRRYKYIYLAWEIVTEMRVANIFRFNDIFDNLSIHYFKSETLSTVDSSLWGDLEEPKHDDPYLDGLAALLNEGGPFLLEPTEGNQKSMDFLASNQSSSPPPKTLTVPIQHMTPNTHSNSPTATIQHIFSRNPDTLQHPFLSHMPHQFPHCSTTEPQNNTTTPETPQTQNRTSQKTTTSSSGNVLHLHGEEKIHTEEKELMKRQTEALEGISSSLAIIAQNMDHQTSAIVMLQKTMQMMMEKMEKDA